uniref:Cytochrome P450 n=1 Tax=Mycena chlorophos TaxID=658473 RepID=A0ABQ0M3W5_MYCCL|nr:cytochrome P450 [Mycena chlorophos]
MSSQLVVPAVVVVCCGSATSFVFHNVRIRADMAAITYLTLAVAVYVGALLQSWSSPLTLTGTLAGLYATSALLTTAMYRLSPWHKLASYPGPLLWRISALPLVYASFRGKRYLVIDELHNRYGDFVRIAPDALSIKRKSANQVIHGPATHMEKADSYLIPIPRHIVALFFKQPTRTLHTERKKIWQPAFTSKSIANFAEPLERRTWQLLETIERRQDISNDGSVELTKALTHWAYDFTVNALDLLVKLPTLILDIVLAPDLDSPWLKGLLENGDPTRIIEGGKFSMVLLDSLGQAPWLVHLAYHLPIAKAQMRFFKECGEMMAERVLKDGETAVPDIASHFLGAEGHYRPTLEEMQLDALVVIQGGSDNTSMTASLACFHLLSSQGGRQWMALQAELDGAFQDITSDLDWDVLAQLPYLNAVISETLRLSSPYYLPRVVGDGGVAIDGHFVPKGMIVALAAYSLQTDAANFYPEPLEFRAERWLPDAEARGYKTDHSASYSFASGPHVCIGKALAYQEMRLVLARLVLTFDMEFAPGFDPTAFKEGIMNMRTTIIQRPLKMRARRRAGVTSTSSRTHPHQPRPPAVQRTPAGAPRVVDDWEDDEDDVEEEAEAAMLEQQPTAEGRRSGSGSGSSGCGRAPAPGRNRVLWDAANAHTPAPMPAVVMASSSAPIVPLAPAAFQPQMRILKRSPNATPSPSATPAACRNLARRIAQRTQGALLGLVRPRCDLHASGPAAKGNKTSGS